MGLFLVSRFLIAIERVERRNMFWHLGKRALIAANNRIYPKIASLAIYEVLIANTLDRAAIFFSGHSYLESTTVLSDMYIC